MNNFRNMDNYFNDVWSHKPYSLSYEGDKHTVIIPQDILQYCAKQDMFVLDFLYRSYKKGLNGVILNTEEDLNAELQVSTFLAALNIALKSEFPVLVLCPNNSVIKWHYYMTLCEVFAVKIVTAETSPEELTDNAGTILLLSFSNIKILIESLTECNFFSVVLDRFDEVATKRLVCKLRGCFNIGISYRNFYIQPNQKLQWTMLNWANPGSVGKLSDFYETDSDNFANFRDNYKEWWFRITWRFCESFVKPTPKTKEKLDKILSEWANEHNLSNYFVDQNERNPNIRKRKGKIQKENNDTASQEENIPKRTKKVYNKATRQKNKIIYNETRNIIPTRESYQEEATVSSDSSDTIIYGNNSLDNLDEEIMGDVDNDQLPITSVTAEEKNKRVSSGEEPLLSFANEQKSNSLEQTNSHHIKDDTQQVDTMDDESDIFLKSVAGKDTYNSRQHEHLVDTVFNEDSSESQGITHIDLELSEQIILGSDMPTESDAFLKEICGERIKGDTCDIEQKKNYNDSTYTVTADVDKLLAEVLQMIPK